MLSKSIVPHFPYEWINKEALLDRYDKHPEILEYVRTCEQGKHWKYCDCHKCDTLLKLYNLFQAKRGSQPHTRPIKIEVQAQAEILKIAEK